jgi:hypothetical protein
MALGKEVDRVDLGRLEYRHEPIGMELGPDARDVLGRMKIDMNLAERERKHWMTHLVLSSLTA